MFTLSLAAASFLLLAVTIVAPLLVIVAYFFVVVMLNNLSVLIKIDMQIYSGYIYYAIVCANKMQNIFKIIFGINVMH